jgi:ATP-dependent RNA helicase DDX42
LASYCSYHGTSNSPVCVRIELIFLFQQEQLKVDDGPIVLICAPTRELAQQIYLECKKYGKPYNINAVCAFGGGNMYEQITACKEGCEILVCTPVRKRNRENDQTFH